MSTSLPTLSKICQLGGGQGGNAHTITTTPDTYVMAILLGTAAEAVELAWGNSVRPACARMHPTISAPRSPLGLNPPSLLTFKLGHEGVVPLRVVL